MSFNLTSTISAFQNTLTSFKFAQGGSFSERFAQKRFLKKMERPVSTRIDDLRSTCWNGWLSNDGELPVIGMPSREWYIARDSLHRNLGHYRPGPVVFPKGSELAPTRGQNSVEARLTQSRWTCTYDNFDAFSRLCYNHKALKRAARRRYCKWFYRKGFDITMRQSDRILYSYFKDKGDPGKLIFDWKLRQITSLVHGSRFSTVPKNNEKRRPINIEPFGNILTQRQMGEWLRSEILRIYGLDLNTLADVHRQRIKDVENIATIDLKDASDSISIDLCRFVLPSRIYHRIMEFRSSMVLGPDGSYHLTKKISSMGNGFTFELMTLILLSVCRALDPESTVFGDDIIIDRSKAERLMNCLSDVGLKVNFEKSFIDGPFRESCGANFHSDEGYIESYDFLFPESIGDCVLIWNKCRRLSLLYPSFKNLSRVLYRSIPLALRGGPCHFFDQVDHLSLKGKFRTNEDDPVTFPLRFITDRLERGRELPEKVVKALTQIHYNADDFRLVPGFEFKSKLRSPTLSRLHERVHWAKYEMYLSAGRRSKDVVSSSGEWVKVWFVVSGYASFRVRSLTT